MRLKLVVATFSVFLLAWGTEAQAGAIRAAGKLIAQGTTTAVSATANGAQAAASGVTTVGKATGGALVTAAGATGNAITTAGNATVTAGKSAGDATADGAVTVAHGARKAPGLIAQKTSAGAKALWHIIW